MSKPIVLTEDKWSRLKDQLYQDYPKSVLMIRWKMKEILGFTVREHTEWKSSKELPDCRKVSGRYVTTIQLDFYKDSVQTMFRLRYSEFI